jgi:hypothetical protein
LTALIFILCILFIPVKHKVLWVSRVTANIKNQRRQKMKKVLLVVSGMALFVAYASFAFGAEQAATTTMKKHAGESGTITVMTATATATVQAVDTDKRTVTLKMPDGKEKMFKLGKDVKNFDKIKVGDKVKATYVEELAVYLSKAGPPPGAEGVSEVMLAPKGSMPGAVTADTIEMTAKVKSINSKKRTVTLIGPEGNTKTLKVPKTVNLKQVKKGDDVTVRYTEALALKVEKP